MVNCLSHKRNQRTAMSRRATTVAATLHADARWHATAPTTVAPIFVGTNGIGAYALGMATKPYHLRPKEKLL